MLKKQIKVEGVDVNVQLWIYPEKRTGAAKRVCYILVHISRFFAEALDRLNFLPFLLILKTVLVLITCLTKSFRKYKMLMTVALHQHGQWEQSRSSNGEQSLLTNSQ